MGNSVLFSPRSAAFFAAHLAGFEPTACRLGAGFGGSQRFALLFLAVPEKPYFTRLLPIFSSHRCLSKASKILRKSNLKLAGQWASSSPRAVDFLAVSPEDFAAVIDLLNHRPRKGLGWRTPFEVFFGVALA